MSDFRLYGGNQMSGSEVDLDNDLIPIRDASITGNNKHRKINVRQLGTIIGGSGGTQIVTSAVDPTILTVLEGENVIWFNTALNQVYNWANIGGVLWHSPAWVAVTSGNFVVLENGEFFELENGENLELVGSGGGELYVGLENGGNLVLENGETLEFISQ